ncbi:MAG: hypothetical protein GX224_03205 [Thermoplasmatales archaeon]|nr:hypothetical protein [Thermoplasmatales archaeon]
MIESVSGDAVTLAKLAIYVSVMALACLEDLRDREASDGYWAALGAAAVVFMILETPAFSVWRIAPIAGTAVILLYLLWPGEEDPVGPITLVAALVVLFVLPAYLAWDDPFVRGTLSVPVLFILFVAMYYVGAIKGGADVKCLIVTSMLFVTYPSVGPLPLIAAPSAALAAVFPFALATLFFAALFSLLPVPYVALRNLRRGDSGALRSFTGYYMPIAEAREAHVWPLQNVVDGTVVWTRHPQEGECVYDALEAAGAERVWVTPKIPFLVPILAAAAFLVVVGNPFFLLA